MDSIKLAEVAPGEHRLYLVAGTTGVDDVIAEFGHEPNGVFWEGIAELLITSEAPYLDGQFQFDSEAGAFLAYSGDRAALDDLAIRLRAVAVNGDRVRQLVELAGSRGFAPASLVALVLVCVMRLRRAPPRWHGQGRVRGAWSAARESVVPHRRSAA